MNTGETQKVVQAAYQEFKEGLEELYKQRQRLFKQAVNDLEQIALNKARKQLGRNE